MDLDLASSSKRLSQQRQQRQQERAKALLAERAGRKLAEEAEAKQILHRERLRTARTELAKREADEVNEAGGVDFRVWLRPVPLTSAQSLETDRIRLPPSALATPSLQGALTKNIPLTFHVMLYASVDAIEPLGFTYAGVSEFSAEEGTVVLPLKTALSLNKIDLLDNLDLSNMTCRVRYMPLPHYERLKVTLQPLRQGFHNQGQGEVSIDLKSVLRRALGAQATLSEGDIVPLRHESQTYYLRVKHLEPEPRALLLNTEVEIDLLPSEDTESALARVQQMEEMNLKRRKAKQDMLQSLPVEPAVVGDTVVTVRARLPAGTVISRRFHRNMVFKTVHDWAWASCVDDDSRDDGNVVDLVQSYGPGDQRVLTLQELGTKTLIEIGWKTQKVETVNIRLRMMDNVLASQDNRMATTTTTTTTTTTPQSGAWKDAVTQSTMALDEAISNTHQDTEMTMVDDDVKSTHDDLSSEHVRRSPAEELKFLLSQGVDLAIAKEVCTHDNYLQTMEQLRAMMGLITTPLSVKRAANIVVEFRGGFARIVDKLAALSGEDVNLDVEPRCGGCGKRHTSKATLSLCGGCSRVGYCNATCAGAHWNESHRERCHRDRLSALPRDWSRELAMLKDLGIAVDGSHAVHVVQVLVKYDGNLERAAMELLAG